MKLRSMVWLLLSLLLSFSALRPSWILLDLIEEAPRHQIGYAIAKGYVQFCTDSSPRSNYDFALA
jgi:hypothetical protein